MILYHFTRPEHLPAIAAHGIVPRPDVEDAGGKPVVWLTEATTNEWTKADRAKFEARGGNTSVWLVDCSARLTVRIGSHDRKLVRYLPWLRRHPFPAMPDLADTFEAMEQWWIYFGTIPREKILDGLPKAEASLAD